MAHVQHRITPKGTDRWRVYYRTGGRGATQRTKTFASETKAKKYAALVETVGWADAEAIIERGASPAERTVSEQVAHHIAHLNRIGDGTRSDYLHYADDIRLYLGTVPLSGLTRDMVTTFVQRLSAERHLAPKTIMHRHSLLSASLRSAVRSDLIPRNVAEGIEIPKPTLDETQEMVTLTVPEVRTLLSLTPAAHLPLVATLVGTGMRFGEATALQVKDINLDTQTIRVRRAWKHTDGHGHQLGLPKSRMGLRTLHAGSLVHILAPLIADRPADAWVFTNARGGPVRHNTWHPRHWQPIVTKLEAKTGKAPRIHDLRHTYASIKVSEGRSMAWLQKQLGHEQIGTTIGTYTHLQTADLAQLGDVLDWETVTPGGSSATLPPAQS